jgi:hypothetical protein
MSDIFQQPTLPGMSPPTQARPLRRKLPIMPGPQPQEQQMSFPEAGTINVGAQMNQQQRRRQQVGQQVQNLSDAFTRAQYFRHAGFGAALRHTMGLKQTPSHVNDYLNARHNQTVRGINPSQIDVEESQYRHVDPYEPWHWQ